MSEALRSLGSIVAALSALACTTGEGTGWVSTERLFVEECWNGKFNLAPDFFGAIPFEEEQLFIRVQRGDNTEDTSDGLIVLVNELRSVRSTLIDQDIAVGLPVGVSPPGVPLTLKEPVLVSLSLYLNDTCPGRNSNVYSISGSVRFSSLFSGDLNESDAADRLSEGKFENVVFADPRRAAPDGSYAPGLTSSISGYFKFFFQRGQPAQPFL